MLLLHKKEGPLKLLKTPKSTFYRIWSVFGGVSNLLPISADYSLKSQIGIGKNWVGPPPREKGGALYIDVSIYDGMARKTGYLETILPDIAETPNFQAMLRVDERHSIRNKKSLRAF